MAVDSHYHALKADFIDLTGGPSTTPFNTPRSGSGAQGARHFLWRHGIHAFLEVLR